MTVLVFRTSALWPEEKPVTRERTGAWEEIAPFFKPPARYADDLGSYRPPLIFDDGTRVKTAADWSKRRKEILKTWHELMGPWPELLEKPTVEVIKAKRRENFTQKRVRLEVCPGKMQKGYLLVPNGKAPFPAVLVVYYDPETGAGLNKKKPVHFGDQLTRRGFVTLSVGWPAHNPKDLQPLSYLAYVAANCHTALANMEEVDGNRIGIVGHSFGGKWAMFASCLWEKFACGVWSDGGIVFDERRANVNYWEPWYLGKEPGKKRKEGIPTKDNPRTGAYKVMIETGRDLHELHALMAPRPFLVSGGSEDPPERWRALNHTVEVNRLLGFENRVAMTNRKGHSPTEESNEQIYAFFEHFLMHATRDK